MKTRHVLSASLMLFLLGATFGVSSAWAQSEFAASSVGQKAPEAPKTPEALNCPKGTKPEMGKEMVWCNDPAPKSGKFQGPVYSLYKSGTVKRFCPHFNGKAHGVCMGYRQDGSLNFKEEFKEGKQTRQVVYDAADKGNVVTYEATYTPYKQLGSKANWSGEGKGYYKGGKVKYVETYKGGKMVKKTRYDEEGHEEK